MAMFKTIFGAGFSQPQIFIGALILVKLVFFVLYIRKISVYVYPMSFKPVHTKISFKSLFLLLHGRLVRVIYLLVYIVPSSNDKNENINLANSTASCT